MYNPCAPSNSICTNENHQGMKLCLITINFNFCFIAVTYFLTCFSFLKPHADAFHRLSVRNTFSQVRQIIQFDVTSVIFTARLQEILTSLVILSPSQNASRMQTVPLNLLALMTDANSLVMSYDLVSHLLLAKWLTLSPSEL